MRILRRSFVLILLLAAPLALTGCAGSTSPESEAQIAELLQSLNGEWTREEATLQRMRAQNEGTSGMSVNATDRVAVFHQVTGATISARFEDVVSPGVALFRAMRYTGGRAESYVYTCRLTDPRTAECRMQIGTMGGWTAKFIRG